jgi:hypothetical protein
LTLVAVAVSDKWPILFGDLLLSSSVPPAKEISLPTQNISPSKREQSDFWITGLTQKLCIITDCLAVGWSGTKITAKTIIHEMTKSFTPGQPVSLGEVEAFFKQIDYGDDVSIIGMALGEGRISRFGWKAQKHTSTLFDEIRVAGSGSEHFLQLLNTVDLSFLSGVDGLPVPYRPLGKVLLCVGGIVGEEMNTGSNFDSFYGGGFEFVLVNENKFEKLRDVTYLFWGVQVNSPEELRFRVHPLAVKFSYTRDILVVRRTEFAERSDKPLKDMSPGKSNEYLILVTPINRNLDRGEIEEIKKQPLPDLNSPIFCHYVLLKFPNASLQAVIIVDVGKQEMIKFTEVAPKLFLTFTKAFVDRLVDIVRQRMT